MKQHISIIFFLFFFLAGNVLAAEIEGDYTVINKNKVPEARSLEQVNITEIFSFTCPHCYNFHKELPTLKEKYGNKIILSHSPIGWSGENAAKLFFVAQANGKTEEIRDVIFRAFHDSGIRNINNAKILEFFADKAGIKETFLETKDTTEISSQVKRANYLVQIYRIKSTPSFIIENALVVSRGNLEIVVNSLLKNE